MAHAGISARRNGEKMKKRFIAGILSLALITAALSGCTQKGGAGNNTSTPTGEAPQTDGQITTDPVTLTVWESAEGPDKWIKQAGEAFTAQYPNITVKYVNVELGDTASQIAIDGPAGVGPDLFAAPHDKLGELVTGGHVLETENAEKIDAMVLPACSQALTYDGKMYGYPTAAETYALYYNKALISEERVPKTWEKLMSWCETFNAENRGKYGFVMDVTSCYYTILFTTLNGNRLFGADGADTSSSYLATPDAVSGMEVFQKLKSILNISAEDMTTATADGAFAAGSAAMHISGPWNVSVFKDAGIDFGVATLPSLDGENPAASFSGTRGMFVSAYSAQPAEAALFAEFLISEEMQTLRYSLTGALPAIDCQLTGEYAEYSEGFVEQLNYAFPMPSVPQMSAFWDAAGAASVNIWNGADVSAELRRLDDSIVGSVSQ